jgi:hypothetical protein
MRIYTTLRDEAILEKSLAVRRSTIAQFPTWLLLAEALLATSPVRGYNGRDGRRSRSRLSGTGAILAISMNRVRYGERRGTNEGAI